MKKALNLGKQCFFLWTIMLENFRNAMHLCQSTQNYYTKIQNIKSIGNLENKKTGRNPRRPVFLLQNKISGTVEVRKSLHEQYIKNEKETQ
jgi:hypothetical protein